jgi:hypothetical protein
MAPFNGTVKTVDFLRVLGDHGTAAGAWDLF